MDELHERLGTKEEEKEIYNLAKVREKQSRDFQNVWYIIKSKNKRVLTNYKNVKNRMERIL